MTSQPRRSVNARMFAGYLMLVPIIWVLMPVFMLFQDLGAGVGIQGFWGPCRRSTA